jgi:hypothetical protein
MGGTTVDAYLFYLFFVKAGKGRGAFSPADTMLLWIK